MSETVKSMRATRVLFFVAIPIILAFALIFKLSTSEAPAIAQPTPSSSESIAVDENGEPYAFSCPDRKWCEEHLVLPSEEPSND